MATKQDRDDRAIDFGPQDNEKPTFDDKMANLRAAGDQLNADFKISDKLTSFKKGTIDRVKAVGLIYGIWLGTAIVAVNPVLLLAVPVIAAAGAVDAYKNGSNNFVYNSFRSIKESVGLIAGDAVTLAKLPFKAAAFMLGLDEGKKTISPAASAETPQAQQAQPEVQGADKGFGKKLSAVFGAFAPRDAAANANGLKRDQQVSITPAAQKQNTPKGPGSAG